ncbi:hypothetical protein EG329_012123 [Mollisiaceae sp. DMI_Dod_QoI]|nr:hypothetical protein EG329_012123 [Helotiales sp. DMI_Dod_QoI]
MTGRRDSGRRPSRSASQSHRHSTQPDPSRRASTSGRRRHSSAVVVPVSAGAGVGLARNPSQGHREAHQHPNIEDDLPNPTPAAYYVRDLARALRANAAGASARFATRLDNVQLGILRDPLPADLGIHLTAGIRFFLESWVGIFDTVFFFGTLIRRGLEGGFSLYNKPGSRVQGFYEKEKKNIRINTWDSGDDPAAYAERLVCVLFHTMLNAFCDLYRCKCSDCLRKNSANHGGIGTGHGPPWSNAMAAMQEELQKEVRWVVDCHITESVQLEMAQSDWQPRNDQLARWGIGSSARPVTPPARHPPVLSPPVRPPPIRLPADNDDDDHHHYHRRRTEVKRRDNAEDDDDHHRRAGVKQKKQTKKCVIM